MCNFGICTFFWLLNVITSCAYQYQLKSIEFLNSNEFIKQSNLVWCTSGWQRLGREGVGIWDIILQDSLTQRPCQAPRNSPYTLAQITNTNDMITSQCATQHTLVYKVSLSSLLITLSIVYTKYQSSSCPSPRRPPLTLPQVYISPSRLSIATGCGPQPIKTTSELTSFNVEGMGTDIKDVWISVSDNK